MPNFCRHGYSVQNERCVQDRSGKEQQGNFIDRKSPPTDVHFFIYAPQDPAFSRMSMIKTTLLGLKVDIKHYPREGYAFSKELGNIVPINSSE